MAGDADQTDVHRRGAPLQRPRSDHAGRRDIPAVQSHHGAERAAGRQGRRAARRAQRRTFLAGSGADRGAGRRFLARLGDHRGGDGRSPGGDDDRGLYRHRPDAVGQQTADALRQRTPDYRYPVPELPADDWL